MGILSVFKNFLSARGRAQSLYERGMLKAKKEDYVGAISDYTTLLRMDGAPEDHLWQAQFIQHDGRYRSLQEAWDRRRVLS